MELTAAIDHAPDARPQDRPVRGEALLLGNARTCISSDRTWLRKFGIEVPETLASGAQGLDSLIARPRDFVLCGQTLADMSGLDFIRLARLHPGLQTLPVILVSTDNTRAAVQNAISTGCSGYLIRPYSPAGFSRQIQRALKLAELNKDSSLDQPEIPAENKEFDTALRRITNTSLNRDKGARWFERGLEELEQGKIDSALALLNRALFTDRPPAETHEALARAWERKGRADLYLRHMLRARAAFAAEKNYADAARVGEQITASAREEETSFSRIGSLRLRRGDLRGAALAYVSALKIERDGSKIFAQIARDCLFTSDPIQIATQLCRVMAETAPPSDPQTLFNKIMGPINDLPPRQPQLPNSGVFPHLRDILAVAKYTFKAYRDNLPGQPDEKGKVNSASGGRGE